MTRKNRRQRRRRRCGNRRFKNYLWFTGHGRAPAVPCHWCGRPMMFNEATVDHEPPLSEGGHKDSAVLACDDCNQRRGRETSARWRRRTGRGKPMKREQILAMPAGPEMDAAVAARVMGNAEFLAKQGCDPPAYSTDIRAAWQVVDWLWMDGWSLVLRRYEGSEVWNACIGVSDKVNGEIAEAEAETAPLAICRAALLMSQKAPHGHSEN